VLNECATECNEAKYKDEEFKKKKKS